MVAARIRYAAFLTIVCRYVLTSNARHPAQLATG